VTQSSAITNDLQLEGRFRQNNCAGVPYPQTTGIAGSNPIGGLTF